MSRLGLKDFERDPTEAKCHSHHISRVYTNYDLLLLMLALITWLRSYLPGFSIVKLLSSTQYCTLCNEVTMYSPHLGVVLFLKVECLHKLLEIFQK